MRKGKSTPESSKGPNFALTIYLCSLSGHTSGFPSPRSCGMPLDPGRRLSKNAAGKLARDEGQRGRKAARRKRRVSISGFQRFGCVPKRCDEPGVGFVKRLPRCLAEGMEKRRWRTRELRRTVLGVLGENRFHSDHRPIGLLSPKSRVFLDLRDQGGDARPIAIDKEDGPSREWATRRRSPSIRVFGRDQGSVLRPVLRTAPNRFSA